MLVIPDTVITQRIKERGCVFAFRVLERLLGRQGMLARSSINNAARHGMEVLVSGAWSGCSSYIPTQEEETGQSKVVLISKIGVLYFGFGAVFFDRSLIGKEVTTFSSVKYVSTKIMEQKEKKSLWSCHQELAHPIPPFWDKEQYACLPKGKCNVHWCQIEAR